MKNAVELSAVKIPNTPISLIASAASSTSGSLKVIGYKIRNTKMGLYSLGRTDPKWSKFGKVWAGLNQLNNHLSLVASGLRHSREDRVEQIYHDCEIVFLVEGWTKDVCKHRTQKV